MYALQLGVPSHMYGTYRQFRTGSRNITPDLPPYERPKSPTTSHFTHNGGKSNTA